jgi:hypothetical protein
MQQKFITIFECILGFFTNRIILFRIGFHRTNYGALDASDACTDDKSKMVLFVQIGGEISTGQSKEHHIFLLWTPS